MRKQLLQTGFKVLQKYERLIAKYAPNGNDTFIDSSNFEWSKNIEKNWSIIRKELEEVLQYQENIPRFQDISADQASITTDNKWKTFFLYGYGFKSELNCKLCPQTAKLLEQNIPGMKTAMFSILEGGKHIPAHRGPYKGVLRLHLGLIVPEPNMNCRIRVGEDYAHWDEGKCMFFDDTHNHEVWNDSPHQRVVLFVDFVRPMPFPLSAINSLIIWIIGISPFVQDGKKNQAKWDEKLEKIVNQLQEA